MFPTWRALEVGLRVLTALNAHTPPAADDEGYLRDLTGDTTTPVDELACEIITDELRRMRAKNEAIPK